MEKDMLRMLIAMVFAALVVLVTGPKWIAWLRKLKFGQTIYELGPQSHKQKQGTPTMGGIMTTIALTAAVLVCHPAQWNGAQDFLWPMLFVTLGSMAVGFADDWIKVVKKRSLGLTPWQKIFGQVFVAVAFAVYCYLHPMVGSKVWVPFVNIEWDLGIFYIPLCALTVIFIVNSANLQDGLDGILSSVTAVGSLAWGVLALMISQAYAAGAFTLPEANHHTLAVFAFALVGACIGFLRFNHYPAKVFMGDTGSMLIGGATVGLAFLTRQPFLLLLIAFTMVASSVSVIIQRYYYKATRKIYGEPRRLFKMTPIHHHFELSGMKETKVVLMYAIVTAVLSLIAIWGVSGAKIL
ncbi:MAG: phospho-N-acetylmuramoyl-pentapeptide-transferase [Clostridiales bacterium]|nr:phospho-N-acetylmuramoyl-pentapeptide-transferase [Clostridiales bacterium]